MGFMSANVQKWQHGHLNCNHKNWLQSKIIHKNILFTAQDCIEEDNSLKLHCQHLFSIHYQEGNSFTIFKFSFLDNFCMEGVRNNQFFY